MKRLATAIAGMAILIPLQGAIAGAGSTSGTELTFYDPATSSWQVPGGTDFYYGAPGDTPLLCDWNGNGKATVGVYRRSTGYLLLHNENSTGAADYEFYYGIPGDRPVCGDWNGNGIDTIAIFRPSEQRFYLRNTNSQGFGDLDFRFGFVNGIPFAGDFNGDGIDTVGVRDPKNGFVAVARGHVSDTPVMEAYFGSSADTLVVGDWDGDGIDRIGVYQPATNTLAVTNLFGSTKVANVYDLGRVSGIPLAAEFNPTGGVATSFPEWDGNPVTNVVTPKNTPTAPTTTTTLAPPPPPPPASASASVGDDWYGTGFKAYSLRPRTAGSTDWALPWEAPRSGNIASFATQFVFSSGNYFSGSGGINRFSIRPDVNGQPGQSVLGEFTITNPTAGGGIWSDWATRKGNWDHFGFNNPVPVTGGTRYWVVAENLHSDPVSNWVGINSVSWGDGAPGTSYVHMETAPGSNLFERFEYPGEGWFAGLFDLKYADGSGFGQGYLHASFEQNVGGVKQAREILTPSTDRVVSDVRVWAERTSGDGALSMTLRSGGTAIAQGSTSGSGWIVFPVSNTLRAGITYHLEFSAPSGTTFKFSSFRENRSWSSGSRFVDGYADYNTGSGWTGGWPIWGNTSPEGDLMFYFN